MAKLREFHQAKWDEELIHELHVEGEKGIIVPQPEEEVSGNRGSEILGKMRRKQSSKLPEVNQLRVLRHYMRLSQEILAVDNSIASTFGTATMKYNPKVQEEITSRNPGITKVHPLQDPETMQGLLEIIFKTEEYIKEISGLDGVSLQAGAGVVSAFSGASIIREYHKSRGDYKRDEIITSLLSHPADAAAPATAGFKIINIMPKENGLPDLEAVKNAVSERTAGLIITNPEDSGIFNPDIDKFTRIIHDAGGLCLYDQANANALLGITRAKEAGFDMCYFNFHKTFSASKGGFGPGGSALAVTKKLIPFLPVPRIQFNGEKYTIDNSSGHTIGKVRSYMGNVVSIIKAYMWINQLGARGLKEVAEIAVLNSNYLQKKLSDVPGVTIYYDEKRRMEQVRYSWEKLKEDTGIGTTQILQRMIDYGLPEYYPSHTPWIVPEPFSIEPTESYNKADLDEIVNVLTQCAREAYETPEIYEESPPFRMAISSLKSDGNKYAKTEKQTIISTYRKYLRVLDKDKEK